MKKLFLVPVFLMAIGLLSCSKTETDQTYPEINMEEAGAFPLNCDTLWIGQSFSFKALLHDNKQLGSYSLEIHNNFDHTRQNTGESITVYSGISHSGRFAGLFS